jgi:predicted NBD/HSP70 family sugar kinase
MRTHGRLALAVDVRPERTTVALADFGGAVLAQDGFSTPETPEELIDALVNTIGHLRPAATAGYKPGFGADDMVDECYGVGLVVPGMVDRRSGRLLYAPRLRWRDVELRETLGARLALPVHVESAPIACGLARLWLFPEETASVRSFAYASISDGVGVGLVTNGEVIRGESQTAGEFGHISIDSHGPLCVCGKRGCWEAFVGNGATVQRYVDRAMRRKAAERAASEGRGEPAADADANGVGDWTRPLTIDDVIRRAKRGEEEAISAITETGWYLGQGLASVVNAMNPGRIYVGGEITAAWSLLDGPLRQALADGTLTDAARSTPVVPDRRPAEYRLLGAIALVAAPTFAAPRVG